MPFSLDLVYSTLKNFFISEFNIAATDVYKLRFSQSRQQITDSDYSNSILADENFFQLVDRIPVEKGDGLTIIFSDSQIDETYFYELLTPATVAESINASSLGILKDTAKDRWESEMAEFSEGRREQYRRCTAQPTNWYSKTAAFWENHSFSVQDSSSIPPNSISISFDYGKVDIVRPWYFKPFINDKTWYIKDTYPGQLTSYNKDTHNIISMPVSFIVIKNLVIQGTWSPTDLQNFKTQFGPFLVSSATGNQLEYDDIQVIGWILEKMPPLPPLGAEGLPSQTYSLMDNAASANWSSFINPPGGVSPSYDPFVWQQPNANGGGSAAIDNNITLEDGNMYDVLRTFTMQGQWGAVKGYFLPFTLNGNGPFIFSADIGFDPNAPMEYSTGITFQVLLYQMDNGIQPTTTLYNQVKSRNGFLTHIEADLSRFRNQKIAIGLVVENGPPSIGAMAYWVNPVISY